MNIGKDDVEGVVSALNSQNISGKGLHSRVFENDLCDFFNSEYSLSCSSATAGIHMVLLAGHIGPGDEVILPPTAPVMSVLPILAVGATPVFVDNKKDSFNVCSVDLKAKISRKTKLVINVPMWGYANNIDEIVSISHEFGVKVLEDNSHCHGTKLNNKYLGTFADYAIFSTHERKMITTGEGGFFLIKEKSDYELLMEIRSFGEVARSEAPYIDLKVLTVISLVLILK